MTDAADAPQPPGPQPLWLPGGVKFDSLPRSLRLAVTEIINPAYQELVSGAPNALERTTGLTYMHLIWLELVEQFYLRKYIWEGGPRQNGIEEYQQRIAGHLRLVAAKDKAGKFLLQVKAFREKYGL